MDVSGAKIFFLKFCFCILLLVCFSSVVSAAPCILYDGDQFGCDTNTPEVCIYADGVCNELILVDPTAPIIDPPVVLCGGKVLDPGQGCCGTGINEKPYVLFKEACCDDGGANPTVYDRGTQGCCEETADIANPENQVYNRGEQICCEGVNQNVNSKELCHASDSCIEKRNCFEFGGAIVFGENGIPGDPLAPVCDTRNICARAVVHGCNPNRLNNNCMDECAGATPPAWCGGGGGIPPGGNVIPFGWNPICGAAASTCTVGNPRNTVNVPGGTNWVCVEGLGTVGCNAPRVSDTDSAGVCGNGLVAENVKTVAAHYDFETALDASWDNSAGFPFSWDNSLAQDGSWSYLSTNTGSPNSEARIAYTGVANSVEFYFRGSSETASDEFILLVDGDRKFGISGPNFQDDWYKHEVSGISNGGHTFEWKYVKNGFTDGNWDGYFLDNVTFSTIYNEDCDDGNGNSGDGCDACELEYCGDGTTQSGLGEMCDDGDKNNTNACSNSCVVNTVGQPPGECGDAEATIRFVPPADPELCVVGTSTVVITAGGFHSWNCTGAPPIECRANIGVAGFCGDGVQDVGEACDFGGNNTNGSSYNSGTKVSFTEFVDPFGVTTFAYGCTDTTCESRNTSTFWGTCGDTIKSDTEDCDFGANNSDILTNYVSETQTHYTPFVPPLYELSKPIYGCSVLLPPECVSRNEIRFGPSCGDGIRNGPEACDDGDSDDLNACSNGCVSNVAGVCGAANGTTTVSAPSLPTDLCATGANSSVISSGGFHNWSCSGTPADFCSASIGAAGLCGLANGTTTPTAPSLPIDLCANGASSSVVTFGGFHNWICSGTPDDLCSATVGAGIAGICGAANGTITPIAPSLPIDLCANGASSSVVTSGGFYTWSCSGSPADSCSATVGGAIAGVCGAANGTATVSAPSFPNLCNTGVSSPVVTSAVSHTWSCSGTPADFCSATVPVCGNGLREGFEQCDLGGDNGNNYTASVSGKNALSSRTSFDDSRVCIADETKYACNACVAEQVTHEFITTESVSLDVYNDSFNLGWDAFPTNGFDLVTVSFYNKTGAVTQLVTSQLTTNAGLADGKATFTNMNFKDGTSYFYQVDANIGPLVGYTSTTVVGQADVYNVSINLDSQCNPVATEQDIGFMRNGLCNNNADFRLSLFEDDNRNGIDNFGEGDLDSVSVSLYVDGVQYGTTQQTTGGDVLWSNLVTSTASTYEYRVDFTDTDLPANPLNTSHPVIGNDIIIPSLCGGSTVDVGVVGIPLTPSCIDGFIDGFEQCDLGSDNGKYFTTSVFGKNALSLFTLTPFDDSRVCIADEIKYYCNPVSCAAEQVTHQFITTQTVSLAVYNDSTNSGSDNSIINGIASVNVLFYENSSLGPNLITSQLTTNAGFNDGHATFSSMNFKDGMSYFYQVDANIAPLIGYNSTSTTGVANVYNVSIGLDNQCDPLNTNQDIGFMLGGTCNDGIVDAGEKCDFGPGRNNGATWSLNDTQWDGSAPSACTVLDTYTCTASCDFGPQSFIVTEKPNVNFQAYVFNDTKNGNGNSDDGVLWFPLGLDGVNVSIYEEISAGSRKLLASDISNPLVDHTITVFPLRNYYFGVNMSSLQYRLLNISPTIPVGDNDGRIVGTQIEAFIPVNAISCEQAGDIELGFVDSMNICGDTIVNVTAGEQCDWGNAYNGKWSTNQSNYLPVDDSLTCTSYTQYTCDSITCQEVSRPFVAPCPLCTTADHRTCSANVSTYYTDGDYLDAGVNDYCVHNTTNWGWINADNLSDVKTVAPTEFCGGTEIIDNNCNAYQSFNRGPLDINYSSFRSGATSFHVYEDVDAFDSLCGVKLNGFVNNSIGVALDDVNISLYIVSPTGVEQYFTSTLTDAFGNYSFDSTMLPATRYTILPSKVGYNSVPVTVNLTSYTLTYTYDFTLSLGNCLNDCTTRLNPTVCEESCDAKSGCMFYNDTTASLLDGINAGSFYYDIATDTTYEACEGAPVSGNVIPLGVTTSGTTCPNGTTLVINERVVLYKGEPVVLKVAVCDEVL